VDGGLVGADDHPAATHLVQLAHRRLRLVGHPQQPSRMLEQQRAGLGQRAIS
jgi:hypothetical protein